MKKGLSKLILSGAAVAAVAATLGTSTYAWYTTNPTVSASNILGTAKATGDASISIAQEKKSTESKLTWLPAVEMRTENLGAKYDSLVPLAYKYDSTTPANSAFYPLNKSAKANGFLASSASTDYIAFKLYFKTAVTSADVPLYLKTLNIQNTSVAATTDPVAPGVVQSPDNMNYTGTGTDKTAGILNTQGNYQVDITDAIAMVIESTTAATVKAGTTAGTYVKDADLAISKYAYAMNTKTNPATDPFDNTIKVAETDCNAVEYYNKAMQLKADEYITYFSTGAYQSDVTKDCYEGESLTAANTSNPNKTAIAILPQDGSQVEVNFKVFLNGWDKSCYDAVKGQSFKINMEFTSDITAALGLKTA